MAPKSSSSAGASLSSQKNASSSTVVSPSGSSSPAFSSEDSAATSASDPSVGTQLTQPVMASSSENAGLSSLANDNALLSGSSSGSQKNASASPLETSSSSSSAFRSNALASEMEQNSDVYAHIVIPGTKVDYPVLQSEEDDYYLTHNLDGSSGYPGCIYSNAVNSLDFSDSITVLYGHNMKNGSMFSGLKKFRKKSFFNSHETFSITTGSGVYTYQIFAALSYPEKYIPSLYNVKTSEGLADFLESLNAYKNNASSHFRAAAGASETDKICVLSTCVTGQEANRYLVIGKLIAVEN